MSVSTPVFAMVAGFPLTEMPRDLFIPPDALEILLDAFSGPLDLLLYLIRKQNIDILDIPIALITEQYMQYIHFMEQHRLELAAEYLLMAAMLAEIKSRLLLPLSSEQVDDNEEDPRQELIKKLQAYEQMKIAAFKLDELPRQERDFFPVLLKSEMPVVEVIHPLVKLIHLTEALCQLQKFKRQGMHYQITKEPLSVRERMASILQRLTVEKTMTFHQLIRPMEGRIGVAVTFLALLELSRLSLLKLHQTHAFAMLYAKAVENG